MTVLLLKVNPVGISLYSSYDDISPGLGSEAEDVPQSMTDQGACQSTAEEEFWQRQTAKKFPC